MAYRKTAIKSLLLLAASTAPFMAQAQDVAVETAVEDEDTIVVTATRREGTVQTVPINISAIGQDQISAQGLDNLREVAASVPGVYILDQGSRSNPLVVFRGLNATSLSSFDGGGGGGTVATYVGEVPLFVDLRLNDMERVEFLIGPQGTLYGAGTLGGAVRYIPVRPKLGEISGEVRGDFYTYEEGSGVSTDTGLTVNFPIASTLAFRASADLSNDRGYIDYPYAVQQIGVSNPNVNPANAALYNANLKRLKDLNTDETFSARAALRFNPSETFDATLTYYYQDARTEGRQFSQTRLTNYPVQIGRYENALRVAEPNRRVTQLLALEAELDLGFADLVSSSGYSKEREIGNRDQTDLLITLEYSYEAFPNFTAFTEERDRSRTYTQELRLVSKFDGPFSFIIGGFYNNEKINSLSTEFTPLYDQFLVDNAGGAQLRPDAIEYIAPFNSKLRETAAYGELSYEITDEWQITVGGRYYDYNLRTESAVDFPLFNTVFGGAGPDEIVFDFTPANQKDNGFLYKFNTSYKFTDDALMYATVSEGFRIGNSNGLEPCDVPPDPTQTVCGAPNELEYTADTTRNYELGFKTQWFDRRLTLNAAAYYIDWAGPQVASATLTGSSPITINGTGAETYGVELFMSANITDQLSVRGSYAYTKAQLTDLSPDLITTVDPATTGTPFTPVYIDGEAGDRLPGSPEHQGSFFIDYEMPLNDDYGLTFSYGFTAHSNVLTRTGGRGGGLTLPGFDIHNASIALKGNGWTAQLYADNIFNEFGETGVRGTPLVDQSVTDANGDPVYVRNFGTFVTAPRKFGVRLSKAF